MSRTARTARTNTSILDEAVSLSTGQVSAVNRKASELLRNKGLAATSLNIAGLPHTYGGAAELLIQAGMAKADVVSLLDATAGLSKTALRRDVLGVRSAQKAPKAVRTTKKAAPAKRTTAKPKATTKAAPKAATTPKAVKVTTPTAYTTTVAELTNGSGFQLKIGGQVYTVKAKPVVANGKAKLRVDHVRADGTTVEFFEMSLNRKVIPAASTVTTPKAATAPKATTTKAATTKVTPKATADEPVKGGDTRIAALKALGFDLTQEQLDALTVVLG